MKNYNGILVCALATSEWVQPGSTFDRHCADCGERLMLSREGQAFLADSPGIETVCEDCAAVRMDSDENPIIALPTIEEIERAQREAIPNFWRKRN